MPGGSNFSYAASEVFSQGIAPGNVNAYPSTAARFGPQLGPAGQRQNGLLSLPVRGPPPTRSGPRARGQPILQPPVYKSKAQLQAESGQRPNGEYQINAPVPTWKGLVVKALRIDRAAQPHPKQVLREIMARTETYIKEPEDFDTSLYIWGDEGQVAEAKGQIAQWERDVRESASAAKPVTWYKGRALDGRAEHREDRQNQENLLKELIQEAEIDYPVEAALLWPKELDIEDFEIANLDVITQLRSSFTARISFLGSNTPHIMIAARTHADAVSLMTRMMNLVKETISRRDQLVTVNMIHIPNEDVYRDRVGLLDLDPKTQSYLPTLHGSPSADEEQLSQHRRQVQVSNRKKIKKNIDMAIKKLRVSQQHCRMRFVFGELGFKLFQKPANGAETYSFDDFYTMVTKGRTKLTLNGLPVRQGEITDLADILNNMEAFSDCSEYYAAFFDFPGTTHNSVLRLETVFTPIGDEDTENEEKRWLELSDSVSRLQVGHLNFDRPDYQVTLDAFPLGTDKLPKAQMMAFQARVTMERPPNGIKSQPRRRVHHPTERGLHTVSELIVLKWRFKDTDGLFELRRKDIYDLRPGRESGSPVETRWHALYYYPEWDNLMAEFASVKPGEDVKWIKSVATFFPGGEQWTALPQGFKKFISEVEEIQDLLAEAISRVAKGKGKAKENGDHLNGI